MSKSPFELRLARAKRILAKGGVKHLHDHTYSVPSEREGHKPYVVKVVPDPDPRGQVLEARCQCRDYHNQQCGLDEQCQRGRSLAVLGVCHMDYWPACKHVLAVALEEGVVSDGRAGSG